jgi:two-component system chemotaxis response regulator CheY
MDYDFASLDVLIVEPSAMQAKVVRHACESLGMRSLRCVGRADEALARMREQVPSIVVSALYLPDASGTELVASMRGDVLLREVPFVLVSSETRPQALDPVRQSGVCGILPKPFSVDQLARALRATVDFLGDDTAGGSDFDGESLRVLLVDDSGNARRFMRRVLENLGIRDIVEAENGREAAALLAETMVDLIVTDYNMPEMDGREFVEHVRHKSWQQSVPVLMVTSESDQGRLAAVAEAGVSGICDKPFEPAVVRRLLAGMLAAPAR